MTLLPFEEFENAMRRANQDDDNGTNVWDVVIKTVSKMIINILKSYHEWLMKQLKDD